LIDIARERTTLEQMGLVTTKEAAQILGVTPARVRQFIKDGRLAAEKRGRDHLLEDQEVQRFKRHGRRSGPKGGRPKGNAT
jgi:excisionase family DNA binding protein